MSKVIIGIHGLANKPPKSTLKSYWRKSIVEGLANVGADASNLKFELVYWADYLYKYQLHREAGYGFDPYYNDEPYIKAKDGALDKHDDNWKDSLRAFAGDAIGSALDWTKRSFDFDGLANAVLKSKLKDLDFYYSGKKVKTRDGKSKSAKTVFRAELANLLLKHHKKGNSVMLVAHSMGSIIAYDVLRNLGRTDPSYTLDHFVTIGSPLGLPHVKDQIVKDRMKMGFARADEVRTPTVVSQSWTNYADPLDPVALDTRLADDYGPNDGGIVVDDDIVVVDYEGESGERNHHKSYGYLRAPELSEQIARFLA